MNHAGETYEADGMFVILNSSSTPQSYCEGKFVTDGYNHLYNYKVDIRTQVWNTYDYPGSIPYKVIIDRDGYLRYKGHWFSAAEPIMKQCLGVE